MAASSFTFAVNLICFSSNQTSNFFRECLFMQIFARKSIQHLISSSFVLDFAAFLQGASCTWRRGHLGADRMQKYSAINHRGVGCCDEETGATIQIAAPADDSMPTWQRDGAVRCSSWPFCGCKSMARRPPPKDSTMTTR